MRSAEQKSGRSEGQGRRGLWLGNWGSAHDPTKKNIAKLKGRTTIGVCHAHFETVGAGIFAPNQPET